MLKGATINGKNMLHVGSIFFLLGVVPLRIKNNFKNIKQVLKGATIKERICST